MFYVNLLNAELNPICHLLVLLGAHHIFQVSRVKVNSKVDIIPLFEIGRLIWIIFYRCTVHSMDYLITHTNTHTHTHTHTYIYIYIYII